MNLAYIISVQKEWSKMDLAIGDELTPGYNPKVMNNRKESKILTKALGEKVISKGMTGASLTLKGKNSLFHQLNQFSLPVYNRIFLFYGKNDYLNSKAKLGKIGKILTKAIQIIRKKNQWIKIYGILPLPMYNKKGRSLAGVRGPAFYTLHDLIAMLGITYANNSVPALNWGTLVNPIVNQNNYKKRLIKGRIPTSLTYQLMADRISTFVKNYN